MAWGKTNIGGGSGNGGLDLIVLSGMEKPAKPKNNTVWVKDSAKIAKWTISETEPLTPSEGDSWISTAKDGTLIDPVKKENAILLKIDAIYAFKSGKWEPKDGGVFVNDVWHDISANYILTRNGRNVVPFDMISIKGNAALKEIDGAMRFTEINGGYYYSACFNATPINAAKYKTLVFNCIDAAPLGNRYLRISIWSHRPFISGDDLEVGDISYTLIKKGLMKIDISKVGDKDIWIGFRVGGTDGLRIDWDSLYLEA